jgi:hypothetical protein
MLLLGIGSMTLIAQAIIKQGSSVGFETPSIIGEATRS